MSNFKFAFRAKQKGIDFTDGLDEDQLKANPDLPEKLKGLKIFVTPMTLDNAQAMASRASALDEIADPAEKVSALVKLLGEVFSDWTGFAPRMLATLAPDFVSDIEVAAMEQSLAEDGGRESIPYSSALCTELCQHSTVFWMTAIVLMKKLGEDQTNEDADRKNESPSGSSTKTPEATETTESGNDSAAKGEVH